VSVESPVRVSDGVSPFQGRSDRGDFVSRNGPRDCAKSVKTTVEMTVLKVRAIQPTGRYRVSRGDHAVLPGAAVPGRGRVGLRAHWSTFHRSRNRGWPKIFNPDGDDGRDCRASVQGLENEESVKIFFKERERP
jgi:hypothetical protein